MSETKKNENWLKSYWRPTMAWMYMFVCFFDFVIAPVLWSLMQMHSGSGSVTNEWKPLTLEGAAFFHIAMGAVLGITSYGRTKEKMSESN